MAESISERLAASAERARISPGVSELVEKLLIDVAGLCVAARKTDYVGAALAGWEANGGCTAIGHSRALDAAGAAFVNGTAAHGEDFDDTFEGGPGHAGAVIMPAVPADGERTQRGGKAAPARIAGGLQRMCRPPPLAPQEVHHAGVPPTA